MSTKTSNGRPTEAGYQEDVHSVNDNGMQEGEGKWEPGEEITLMECPPSLDNVNDNGFNGQQVRMILISACCIVYLVSLVYLVSALWLES